MPRKRLGEILVQAGVLDETKLRVALNEQRRWGGPLGRILVDMKLCSEDAMVQALSQQLNFPTIDLDAARIKNDVLDLLPPELAEHHSVIPFNVQGKFLDVAMADPTNLGIIDELRIRTRLNVRPYLCGPKMIERALVKHYARGVAPLPLPADPEADETVPKGRREGSMLPIETAAGRRAQAFELIHGGGEASVIPDAERGREVAVLQARVQHLEALVARDEEVLRKLLTLLIEKGVASREEILDKIR
jgi:type IV pilus assembly protein PilB